MECPKCQQAMKPVEFAGVTVDRCVQCEGIWFDILEHEDLRKAAGSEVIDPGGSDKAGVMDFVRDYECPRCKGRMVKMSAPGKVEVRYEACSLCYGAFFDSGEFRSFKRKNLVEIWRSLKAFASRKK